MATVTKGHCLCRAIEFEFDGEPLWTVHCHCESCRRASSSPVVTWVSVPVEDFRMTKGEPRQYLSSPGVLRQFCGTCGSPVTYQYDGGPDQIHLYAASLENGAQIAPARHVFSEEQLTWFEVHDQLPRFATTKGSGDPPIRIGPRKVEPRG